MIGSKTFSASLSDHTRKLYSPDLLVGAIKSLAKGESN